MTSLRAKLVAAGILCKEDIQAIDAAREMYGPRLNGRDELRIEVSVPETPGRDYEQGQCIYYRTLIGPKGMVERVVEALHLLCEAVDPVYGRTAADLQLPGVASRSEHTAGKKKGVASEASAKRADQEPCISGACVAMCIGVNGQAGTGTEGGESAFDFMVRADRLAELHRAAGELALRFAEQNIADVRAVIDAADRG